MKSLNKLKRQSHALVLALLCAVGCANAPNSRVRNRAADFEKSLTPEGHFKECKGQQESALETIDGERPEYVVLYLESDLLWTVSPSEPGKGTLRRYSGMGGRPVVWAFPATWRYSAEEARLEVTTTSPHTLMHSVRIVAQFETVDAAGATATVSEIREDGERPFDMAAALFKTDGRFISALELMERCAEQELLSGEDNDG